MRRVCKMASQVRWKDQRHEGPGSAGRVTRISVECLRCGHRGSLREAIDPSRNVPEGRAPEGAPHAAEKENSSGKSPHATKQKRQSDHSRDNGTSRDINRARPAPPSRRPRPAKVPLPERWEPSLDDCEWLKREFCIGDNEIDIAAEQFREHARRAGMCPTIGGEFCYWCAERYRNDDDDNEREAN